MKTLIRGYLPTLSATDTNEPYRVTMSEQPHVFKIFLSTMEGYFPVRTDELIYCRAENNYTHFYLLGGKHYLVPKLLKDFEAVLVQYGFFRIHKSFLINIHHIEKVVKADGMSVIMSDQHELPVSFRKKEEFINIIKNFHG